MNSSLAVGRAFRILTVSLAGALLLASAQSAMSESKVSKARGAGTKTAVSRTACGAARTSARRAASRPSARRPAPVAPGMVIGIDPETGGVGMPTPEQMARIAARAPSRTGVRPAPVYHSDGSVSLDVRSWMRDYTVVRLGADGRPVLGCVQGRDAATRVLHEAPASPAAREDR